MASQAFLIEHDKETIEFVGNRTECALLMLIRKWLLNYKDLRSKNEERVAQVSCAPIRSTYVVTATNTVNHSKINEALSVLDTLWLCHCMQVFGFSSIKKMASVLVRTETGYRLYNKVITMSQ